VALAHDDVARPAHAGAAAAGWDVDDARRSLTQPESIAALARLDELTRRLRRECPWDREQDERSIVPHTVEEAYELADAAHAGDDGKLLDELGDVLFQVMFLSLLLEERGAGDLAAVAEHCAQKLIRRHPHVFEEVEVRDAAEVLRNWDQIKRGERGEEASLFGDLPANLPALLYARKAQRRAGADAAEPGEPVLATLRELLDALETTGADREATFDRVGDLLFATVAAARALGVDPELALRQATQRFERRVTAEPQPTQGEPRPE
jgi:MazG family protein